MRARATLAWGLLALALSGAVSVSAYQLTRVELIDERTNSTVTRTYLNARSLRNALRGGDADVAAHLSSLEGSSPDALVARVGGEWFSGSVGLGPDDLPPSLVEVVEDGGAGHQRVRASDVPHVAAGVALPAFDAQYFELAPMDDVERTLGALARGLLAGAAIATVAAAGAGWYASGRVLRPLRDFASVAGEIATGNLQARLRRHADPDLQTLEQAFNRMADAVQDRIDREARFTADVSHELRAPLAAMMAALHIARRRAGGSAAAVEALDEVEERLDLLHELVEALLEISRVEAGVARLQLERVDPVQLASAALASMGGADVEVEAPADVAEWVELDKRRVGQMLQNLIDNANRYGGGVTHVEVSSPDGLVRFAVEDDGEGVADHERSYIFERFARGEAAGRTAAAGTGLGLALVAEHASLHGGSVRLESAPSGGARFVVDLPRQQRP